MIELVNITKKYAGQEEPAVKGLNLLVRDAKAVSGRALRLRQKHYLRMINRLVRHRGKMLSAARYSGNRSGPAKDGIGYVVNSRAATTSHCCRKYRHCSTLRLAKDKIRRH